MSWRRILLFSTALVLVIGAITWLLLQRSDIATELVRKQLASLFRTRVDVASTSLELSQGRLTVAGLALADPTAPDRALLRVERGHVDVRANPLRARIEPRLVVVDGLSVECGPEWPSAESLFAPSSDGPATTPAALPAVEVRSGSVVLHLCADEPPLLLDDLTLVAAPVDEAPGVLQLSGSANLRAPAARLELRGEADLDSGAVQLSLATRDVTLSQEAVAWLARLAKVERQSLDVGARLEELSVLCRIPPRGAADPAPTLVVAASLSALHLDAPGLPAIVRDASVTLRVDTADGGSVHARARQQDRTGDLEVTALLRRFAEPIVELRARGRDVTIDEDVLATLGTFDVGRDVVAALRPTTGRADLDLFLQDPQRRGGDTELELTLRDVAMSFHGFGAPERRVGFPLPLVGAQGRVRLRDDVLLLEDVSADIAPSAGGGHVRLVGRVDTDRPSGEDTSLDIDAEGVAFSQDLRTALSTLLRDDGDLYDKLAPEGRSRVKVAVRPQRELDGGFRVEILPNGAAMRWAGFPYRLDGLDGSIVVRDDGVRFDLTGAHGEGRLTMRGRIPLREQHVVGEGFEAVVDLDALAVDEDLRGAVAVVVPELDATWRAAMPTGLLSGQVKVWRPLPEDPLLHDVRLEVANLDLSLPTRPWRAVGLGGQVLVQGSGPRARIDFDALRGRLENGSAAPAQLALLGHIETGPAPRRDLAFVVRDLELCSQLGDTLDELDALDLQTWTSLRPSGRIDMVCRERREADGPDDLQVVVQLVDVRSEAPMLPKPAEHMTGELRIQDGELTFRDVRAEMGGALVRCWDGRVRPRGGDDDRTEISFAVHAKDFPVDDGLANLFSGPLREAVLARQLRGQADVDGLRLTFVVPPEDSALPFSTTIQGQIGLDGVEMLLGTGSDGIRVLDLRGVAVLNESTVTDAGGGLTGTLRSGSLELFGHRLEAMQSSFSADARRLLLDTLTCRLHDGLLQSARPDAPALTYLLPAPATPEGRLEADLAFERIDVFSLLTTSGWQNPPYSGKASGNARLRKLDGSDVVGAEGEGRLAIERADLGRVPLFAAIYAQLPPADQPRFNQLDVACRLADERVTIESLDVRSDILAAKGSGTFDLDGYLDVRMELDNLLGTSADPFVMPLIDYLAKGLVRFHLFGHLRDLRAEQRWVTERSPGRREVLPMPPARPRRPTPAY